jgi:hypothetical protein
VVAIECSTPSHGVGSALDSQATSSLLTLGGKGTICVRFSSGSTSTLLLLLTPGRVIALTLVGVTRSLGVGTKVKIRAVRS